MEQSRPQTAPPRIEAIDRALDLLNALASAGAAGATLAELASVTGASKPTAYRALSTMRLRGYVQQGPGGEYRLGQSAAALSESYYSPDTLQGSLRPMLTEVALRTEELVHLGAWDGLDVAYLDKVQPSARTMRVWSAPGQRVPAASTALGRALLAARPDPIDLNPYLAALPDDRHVPRTRLAEAITEARRTGFSLEREENEPGIACLGVALHGAGRAVAALSITSLASRMTDERVHELHTIIRENVPALLPPGLSLNLP